MTAWAQASVTIDPNHSTRTRDAYTNFKAWATQEGYKPDKLPAINAMQPYVWTPWRKADEVRGGAFADWERVQGMSASDPEPAAPEPFEMRCRPVLSNALFIPVRAEDANVTKPDPSAGKL